MAQNPTSIFAATINPSHSCRSVALSYSVFFIASRILISACISACISVGSSHITSLHSFVSQPVQASQKLPAFFSFSSIFRFLFFVPHSSPFPVLRFMFQFIPVQQAAYSSIPIPIPSKTIFLRLYYIRFLLGGMISALISSSKLMIYSSASR